MPVPFGFLSEVTITLNQNGRDKTMKQYYMATSGDLAISESSLLAEQDAITSASNMADTLETDLIDAMLDNLPTSVQIVQMSIKSPQQPAFYCIRPIGSYGRGSTTGGDHLGNRVFYTLSSNKNSPQVSRRIHHIWGVYENAQNDGKITPSVVSSVQATWTTILCAYHTVQFLSGGTESDIAMSAVAVEHTKILKNKNDGTEYFAYVLPQTYSGWSWFYVTAFTCKPDWKQFDK